MRCDFSGRVALVTGATGEIGAGVAAALLDQGATVWAVDLRPPPRVPGVAAERERFVQADITDAGAVADLVARIAAEDGGPDLVVNAAGGPGSVRTPVDEVRDEDWARVVALNLDAAFYVCREATRALKRQRRPGSIVNISSGAGRTYSRTGVQAYASAKAGVIGLTRQLARELGPFGIRVNCVAPGLIRTNGTRDELARLPEERLREHLSGVALGRLGEADELVDPILFFLDDGARYVTGQTVSVDGGAVMLG
ncbi:MAG: SDR family oxidoreductase [Nocardioidaceae bacterium]|nr:SDR family oxidoreductase [Nocardioidaceae bacterium]